MTKKELMAMPNLSIAEEKPNMFIHIHTNEGYVVTPFKDGDDIMKYSSSTCMYMPIMDNYADYRTITYAEDKAYKDANRKAHQEYERKMNEERNLNK